MNEKEACSECGKFDVPLENELCEHCWNESAYKEEMKKQQVYLDTKEACSHFYDERLK